MRYTESGNGTPLVLLHAFPVDARMWDDARALLDDQVRVITPDQRGLGESPLDHQQGPGRGMDVLAADVLALLDELNLDSVVLGGCSMGGYVAMAVLRKAPERVAGLVLADTKAEADDVPQRDNRLTAAERAERDGINGWLAEDTLPNVLGGTTHHERPEVVAAIREAIDRQPPGGVALAQRMMAGRPDSTDVLRGYPGPALVVVGEEDSLVPPEQARDLAALLPDAELITLPRVGHLSPVEAPGAFAEAVLNWLSDIG